MIPIVRILYRRIDAWSRDLKIDGAEISNHDLVYNLQLAGANVVAITVTDKYPNVVFDFNIAPVNVRAILLLNTVTSQIMALGSNTSGNIFESEVTTRRRIDPCIILLLTTALSCMAIGMWWGQSIFAEMMLMYSLSVAIENEQQYEQRPTSRFKGWLSKFETVEPVAKITIVGVLFGFVMIVIVLLLSFYFPQVIAPIVVAIYSIGGLFSLSLSLTYVFRYLPTNKITSKCVYGGGRHFGKVKIGHLIAIAISLAIIISFLVIRKDILVAWPLQNIIGIAYCIVFIAFLRVQNLKIITVIMILFFLYDIFFVFITPYISLFDPTTAPPTFTTPSSSVVPNATTGSTLTTLTTKTTYSPTVSTSRPPSVMEAVALGLNSGGLLPIVFVYPYFLPSYTNPCDQNAAVRVGILGLGDVLIPGIFGMYCSIFDLVHDYKKPRIYTFVFLVSYLAGLLFTYLALALTTMAQPALLYIVPSTLIAIYTTAILRRELVDIFFGRSIEAIVPVQATKAKDRSDQLIETSVANNDNVTVL
ncbi:hypothetical protein ACOME3_008205 [Neoechinorhynchus agilis]